MRLCTFDHSGRRRLGVVVGDESVLDAHLATVASLAGHLTVKRSKEIAGALVPPSLMGLLLNGRHGLIALGDALSRLGPEPDVDEVRGPEGEQVVFARNDVELLPAHPPVPVDVDRPTGWLATPFADGGDGGDALEVRVVHSDGRAHAAGCFGVVLLAGEALEPDSALGHLAVFGLAGSPILHTLDEPIDPPVREALVRALVEVSSTSALHTGDVVLTGMVPRPTDRIDLTAELLEALLTRSQ